MTTNQVSVTWTCLPCSMCCCFCVRTFQAAARALGPSPLQGPGVEVMPCPAGLRGQPGHCVFLPKSKQVHAKVLQNLIVPYLSALLHVLLLLHADLPGCSTCARALAPGVEIMPCPAGLRRQPGHGGACLLCPAVPLICPSLLRRSSSCFSKAAKAEGHHGQLKIWHIFDSCHEFNGTCEGTLSIKPDLVD